MASTTHLSPAEVRSRGVLDITMRLLGKNNYDLAAVLHLSYQACQKRRKGDTRLRPQDLEDVAAAWDLPSELFRMEPLDAGAWLLGNRSEQVLAVSTWIQTTIDLTDSSRFDLLDLHSV